MKYSVCLNPVIASGKFEDIELNKSRYRLQAAYIMQRHCDRWVYEHEFIDSYCWLGQQDSSVQSSPLMAKQCLDVPRINDSLATVWQQFPHRPDPYSKNHSGSCQVHDSIPQGSQQGLRHAHKLGERLKQQYVPRLVPSGCPPGKIAIHADKVHKNQLTLRTEYSALCDHLPELQEFPLESTVIGYDSQRKKGTPWYVHKRQCNGSRLDYLTQVATNARLRSTWWNHQVQDIAAVVAKETGHRAPQNEQAAEFVDNILDCIIAHACSGLQDTPAAFLDVKTGLPSMVADSLFEAMNLNETAVRNWNFDYFRSDLQLYREYASLDYGYFFAVLNDQLRAAAEKNPKAPKLTIVEMSDLNIGPQLAFYNLEDEARWRVPYLSTLILEIYEDTSNGDFSIRVLFNGKVLDVCKSPGSFPLCPLPVWEELIAQFIPNQESCPVLYYGYEFLVEKPDVDFPNYVVHFAILTMSLGILVAMMTLITLTFRHRVHCTAWTLAQKNRQAESSIEMPAVRSCDVPVQAAPLVCGS